MTEKIRFGYNHSEKDIEFIIQRMITGDWGVGTYRLRQKYLRDFIKDLGNRPNRIITAKKQGEIIGFILWYKLKDGRAKIHTLATRPKIRKKGIGDKLRLLAETEILKRTKEKKAVLESLSRSTDFWKKRGYKLGPIEFFEKNLMIKHVDHGLKKKIQRRKSKRN